MLIRVTSSSGIQVVDPEDDEDDRKLNTAKIAWFKDLIIFE